MGDSKVSVNCACPFNPFFTLCLCFEVRVYYSVWYLYRTAIGP